VSLDRTTPPQAYLLCANTANGPRIDCVWDNNSFAFLGDIVHRMISTVMFEENAFEVIQAWTKTMMYMLQNLDKL